MRKKIRERLKNKGGFTLVELIVVVVIVLILAWAYYRFKGLTLVQGILSGLRPAVVAMIASAGISLLTLALYGERALPANWAENLDLAAAGIFAAALLLLRGKKPNPIWVMLAAGAAGVLIYSFVP